ncbi:hypothetical protein, partial [Actinomadura rayongensis]|uniref:hypothetical protein n=1 Tax=Actinomadura rayongensis TaxID=1429076 RepID=UPI0035E679BD
AAGSAGAGAAGPGSARAGAAGSAGGRAVQTGAGFLAKAGGVKAVAAVVGAAAVAGGGIAAYETAKSDPPPPRPIALQVASTSLVNNQNGLVVDKAQYVTVSNVKDPAVARKVNAALHKPVDDAIARYAQHANAPGQGPDFIAQQRTYPTNDPRRMILRITTEIGVRGPKLLSVGYMVANPVNAGGGHIYDPIVVTVDLTTGRTLSAKDVLLPSTLTKAGLTRLSPLVPPIPSSTPDYPEPGHCVPSLAQDYAGGNVPENVLTGLPVLLTRTGVRFGFANSGECGYHLWSDPVAYPKVGPYLRPGVQAKATA